MARIGKVPRVNKYECSGCALCAYALPEVFRITPEGFSEAYSTSGCTEKQIQKIMDNCPVNSIHWFNDGK